jgi:hypothetical protein
MSMVKDFNSFNLDEEQSSSSTVNFNETQIFLNLQSKLNNIEERLNKIKNYSQSYSDDNNKYLDYIKKLSEFNNNINNLDAISIDLYNEFILQYNDNFLSEVEKNEQKNIKINKKVNEIFLPYMLYLQILLSNNS